MQTAVFGPCLTAVCIQTADWAPALAGLGELLDDGPAERGEVVGPAAGDEVAVDDDFLVNDGAPGVADVGTNTRVAGQGATADDTGFDERPRCMTDRGNRLARIDEVPNEGHRRLVLPQRVRVHRATGQD